MSKITLVAGSCGFIGTNLSLELLRRGGTVIGIDDFSSGNEESLHALESQANFRFFKGSICDDLTHLEEFKFATIFHLASPASPPKYMAMPVETMEANTTGTKNLINLARRTNARLVFSSTSEIYGDPLVNPQREGYWGNVNPIGPRSVYDESKRFGETILAHYQRNNLVDAAIVRIFNTYGPYMDPFDGRVVSNFIRQAMTNQSFTMYGDGKQTRSFCYIDDMVEALIRVAESDIEGPVNLGKIGNFIYEGNLYRKKCV